MDIRVCRPNAHVEEALRRIPMLAEESIAQVACRVDVRRIVDVTVRVQIRPADFVRASVGVHVVALCAVQSAAMPAGVYPGCGQRTSAGAFPAAGKDSYNLTCPRHR